MSIVIQAMALVFAIALGLVGFEVYSEGMLTPNSHIYVGAMLIFSSMVVALQSFLLIDARMSEEK